jgi:hypothetical protein
LQPEERLVRPSLPAAAADLSEEEAAKLELSVRVIQQCTGRQMYGELHWVPVQSWEKRTNKARESSRIIPSSSKRIRIGHEPIKGTPARLLFGFNGQKNRRNKQRQSERKQQNNSEFIETHHYLRISPIAEPGWGRSTASA